MSLKFSKSLPLLCTHCHLKKERENYIAYLRDLGSTAIKSQLLPAPFFQHFFSFTKKETEVLRGEVNSHIPPDLGISVIEKSETWPVMPNS